MKYAAAILMAVLVAVPAAAADLQPKTVAAFDRYVHLAEADMTPDHSFLRVDTLAPNIQRQAQATLKRGEVYIDRLETRDAGKQINVPNGIIHHWIGTIFIPGATVSSAVTLLQDYDRHNDVFRPAVARAKVLERNGDNFRVYLRFFMKKVLTVVVNTENDARFTRLGPDRVSSRIYSTRVAQVEDPDSPSEHELPVGHDDGFLWRLYTYWHFLERDGGTYIQCESITLTRTIPWGLGFVIGPFVNSIPRESLTFTLEKTRSALDGGKTD